MALREELGPVLEGMRQRNRDVSNPTAELILSLADAIDTMTTASTSMDMACATMQQSIKALAQRVDTLATASTGQASVDKVQTDALAALRADLEKAVATVGQHTTQIAALRSDVDKMKGSGLFIGLKF